MSANGNPLPIEGLFCTLCFSEATLHVYKTIRCKTANVSFWQLGIYCVTVMLPPLTYIKLYCSNTNVNLIVIY